MSTRRKTLLLIVVSLALVIVGTASWVFFGKNPTPPYEELEQQQPFVESALLPQVAQISTMTETQIYRNEEWGFEFEYPANWTPKENSFKNYYSKFNLDIKVPTIFDNEKKLDSAFLVNIVLPEFIRGFDNLEKTSSEIIIDGVRGVKYEYVFNDFPETTVILPFGELQMVLGTGGGSKQYLDEFNQILSTFKFIEPSSTHQ